MYSAHDCQPLFLTEASRPLRPDDIMPDWHEEWLRVVRLAVTLTVIVLLMVASIYLVAARTSLPSIPETQRSGYNGRAYAQVALGNDSSENTVEFDRSVFSVSFRGVTEL